VIEIYIVACLLKTRIVKPTETTVTRERLSKNKHVAKQWFSTRHEIAATGTHATIEKMLQEVFSVRFVPRLHNKEQPAKSRKMLSDASRRGLENGLKAPRAANLRGCEPGSRETSTVGRCYQAVQ
jgi:hypothetical protein